MKTLKYKTQPEDDPMYPDDVAKIVAACALRGYWIGAADATLAWEAYSDSMAAGWMMVDDDPDAVLANVLPYLIEG